MLRRPRPLLPWLAAAACIAAVAVPAAVFAVRFVGQDAYLPTGDIAIAELRVRSTSEVPLLLGPYTRWNAFHPGPLMFYALAPVFWLTGATAFSVHVAAIAVNVAAFGGIVLLARRLGGMQLALLATLTTALFLRAFRVEMLASPWNPTLNLLPLVVATLAGAAYIARSDRALIPLVVATTFVAQTHYGQAPIAVAIGVVALLVARRIPDRRTLLVSAAVLVVLWLPALVQGDNLGDLARLESPGAERIDAGDAAEIVSRQFQLPPQWLTASASRDLTAPYGERRSGLAGLPLALLLVIPAWLLARRDEDASARALLVTTTTAVAAGALATLAIRGTVFPWLYWWTGAAGMAWWTAVAWTVVRRLRVPVVALAPAAALAAAALVFRAGTVDVDGLRYAAGLDARDPSGTIARALAAATPPTHRDKTRIVAADADWGDPVAVTALELKRRGTRIRMGGDMRWPFGPELVGGRDWPALVFIRDGSPTTPPPDGRLVAAQPGYRVYAVDKVR